MEKMNLPNFAGPVSPPCGSFVPDGSKLSYELEGETNCNLCSLANSVGPHGCPYR